MQGKVKCVIPVGGKEQGQRERGGLRYREKDSHKDIDRVKDSDSENEGGPGREGGGVVGHKK
jgi:hypothetical protein